MGEPLLVAKHHAQWHLVLRRAVTGKQVRQTAKTKATEEKIEVGYTTTFLRPPSACRVRPEDIKE
jgi:hypothetical protein